MNNSTLPSLHGTKMIERMPADELLDAPSDPQTTSQQFLDFLRQIQGNVSDKDKPFVFQKLVAYKDRGSSQRWSTIFPDDGCRGEFCATASSFWLVSKQGKKAWFGMSTLPPTNWVGVPIGEDKEIPREGWWHAVAFGVIAKQGGGKVMIIYDCDVAELPENRAPRPRDVIRHETLKEIWKLVHDKSKSGTAELWVNISDPSKRDRQQCVGIACRRLAEWVSHGDDVFTGEDDSRLKGNFCKITGL